MEFQWLEAKIESERLTRDAWDDSYRNPQLHFRIGGTKIRVNYKSSKNHPKHSICKGICQTVSVIKWI